MKAERSQIYPPTIRFFLPSQPLSTSNDKPMAQFFKAKTKSASNQRLRDCLVTTLDHHLRGVVKQQNKTLFVEGVLPGERVDLIVKEKHKADLLKRHSDHPMRCKPQCGYFERCGGCQNQYWPHDLQLQAKATGVGHLLKQLGGFEALPEPSQIVGPAWHYRRVTRLATWFDKAKGWQAGYRQKRSKQLVVIDTCPILTQPIESLLGPLQQFLAKLPKSCGLGHIELIDCLPVPVVRLRLHRLDSALRQHCEAFADEQQVSLILAPTDQEQQWLRGSRAYFELDGCEIDFTPGHFIQVNAEVNQQMVAQAIEWLAPQADETVLDLFCGVGNFSLPLAKRCKSVIAIEGVESMAKQVLANAANNNINNLQAHAADLESEATSQLWQFSPAHGAVDKVLLDPARAGAKTAIASVAKAKPQAVVYVSCDPATLARDARVMNQAGYQLVKWAVMDMFPHTEHVETMVLFQPTK